MNFQFSANHKHVDRAIHVKKEIEFVGNKHDFRQLRNDNDFIIQSIIELFLGFTTFYGLAEHFSICVREIGARSRKSGFTNRTFAKHVKLLQLTNISNFIKISANFWSIIRFRTLILVISSFLNYYYLPNGLKLWEKRFSPRTWTKPWTPALDKSKGKRKNFTFTKR